MPIGPRLRHELIHYQLNEITVHYFYKRLAASVRTPQNRAVLEKIAGQKLRHYQIWRQYTGTDVRPGRIRLWTYLILARLLGFTFAIKLAVFNYYISIAMGFSFRTRFLEMAGLSMGVALLSFLVGIGVCILLGIET